MIINSFEDLEERLKNWINFSGEGDYDFIGMMYLLKACLYNLRKYSLSADFEDLEDILSKEEVEFINITLERLSP